MNHFSTSVVCVADRNYSYYVPYKDLMPYLKDFADFVKENKLNMNYDDIPHCVFGYYNPLVLMTTPPDLGKYSQPGETYRTETKNLPNYRIKAKAEICNACVVKEKCSGFYLNDIKKNGAGDLKPIVAK